MVCEVRTSPWWLSSASLSILLWDKFAEESCRFASLGSFASGLPGISSLWNVVPFRDQPLWVNTRRMTSLTLIEGDILSSRVFKGGYSLSSRRHECLYEGDVSSFAQFRGKPSLFSRRNKCLKCARASTLEAAALRPWGL